MVLNVSKEKIEPRRAVVSDFTWQAPAPLNRPLAPPKYRYEDGSGNPFAQLDPDARIIDPALWEKR
jgi:hypothetical protein